MSLNFSRPGSAQSLNFGRPTRPYFLGGVRSTFLGGVRPAFTGGVRPFGDVAPVLPEAAPSTTMNTGELATTMILRGSVGTLIGAAVAPRGREGIWGAAGFAMGAGLGQLGIIAVALAGLWRKAE